MPVNAPTKLIEWSDRYSVGIASIDAEHRKLVDLVNQLYAAMLAGDSAATLNRVLDGVAAYTLTHFANEEAAMRHYAYPDFARHKAEHDGLVAKVAQLQKDARAGKAAISQEVMSFLQTWLLSHILGVDKKYTAHLTKAGAK